MAQETQKETKREKKGLGKPDLITVGGVLLALGGIAGGLLLEGGSIRDITQLTAAMIVLGGTIGAVMVSTPFHILKGAARQLAGVFFDATPDLRKAAEEVIGYATKARKNGLVSLEQEAGSIDDPFLRKALDLAVDGTDLQEIRKMLELEIEVAEQSTDAEARVFECAGGYAPTIGIIGAVLGLIQVMKNLANIDNIGHGIAVSFVATVYGVASANLFFLPAANKIKARIQAETQRRELILEGVSGIVEGLNPKLIRAKLEAYTNSRGVNKQPGAESKPSGAKAASQPAGAQV